MLIIHILGWLHGVTECIDFFPIGSWLPCISSKDDMISLEKFQKLYQHAWSKLLVTYFCVNTITWWHGLHLACQVVCFCCCSAQLSSDLLRPCTWAAGHVVTCPHGPSLGIVAHGTAVSKCFKTSFFSSLRSFGVSNFPFQSQKSILSLKYLKNLFFEYWILRQTT